MPTDEQQIRSLVATWLDASRTGDLDTLLGLLADDMVFLVPGRSPMSKAEFAALSRVTPGTARPVIDCVSDIKEVQVLGDWAFMWTRLSVTVTPPGGRAATREGHTLSVLRRVDGRWVLARDANVMTEVERQVPE